MSEILLNLITYESNTLGGSDHLNFIVSVSSNNFSGETDFWVTDNYLDKFQKELDDFLTNLKGNIFLKCGWGETPFFEIEIKPYGNLGKILLKTKLVARQFDEYSNELLATMIFDPMDIIDLSSYFQKVLNTKKTIEIRLSSI